VLLQFTIRNRLPRATVADALPALAHPALAPLFALPAPSIAPGDSASALLAFTRPAGPAAAAAPAQCVLRFSLEAPDGDVDEDEYGLDPVAVTVADHVRPAPPRGLAAFKTQWEALGGAGEAVRKCAVHAASMQEAVDAVLTQLRLTSCEGKPVVASGSKTCTVNVQGEMYPGVPVLARAGFMMEQKEGGHNTVSFKVAVRAPDAETAKMVADVIR
jgi:hypothetical protein